MSENGAKEQEKGFLRYVPFLFSFAALVVSLFSLYYTRVSVRHTLERYSVRVIATADPVIYMNDEGRIRYCNMLLFDSQNHRIIPFLPLYVEVKLPILLTNRSNRPISITHTSLSIVHMSYDEDSMFRSRGTLCVHPRSINDNHNNPAELPLSVNTGHSVRLAASIGLWKPIGLNVMEQLLYELETDVPYEYYHDEVENFLYELGYNMFGNYTCMHECAILIIRFYEHDIILDDVILPLRSFFE